MILDGFRNYLKKIIYRIQVWKISRSCRQGIREERKLMDPARKERLRIMERFRSSLQRIPPLLTAFSGLLAAAFIAVILLFTSHSAESTTSPEAPVPVSGFLVSIEERTIGWVETRQSLYAFGEETDGSFSWFFDNREMTKQVDFIPAETEDPVEERSKTRAALTSFLTTHCCGWTITVSGETLVRTHSEEECLEILEQLKALYLPPPDGTSEIRGVKVMIREDPVIGQALCSRDALVSIDDALKYLQKGTLEEKTYRVVPKDTIWSISRKHGMSMEEIARANPDIDLERIYPGDTISLIVPRPFLTAEVTYTTEYSRRIPYRTYVTADSTMYRNETRLVRAGKAGEERVTARVKTVNGVLQEKKIVNVKGISQPVTALVKRGTARTPDDILVSSAFLPAGIGIITSGFGPRISPITGQYHYHQGIDVGAPLGTPVYAYDEGVVEYADYSGIFGYMVVIRHNDSLVTRYGHNDVLIARKGDKVARGQMIAYSGNTGYSTGPHIHFEVIVDDTAVDPLIYFRNRAEIQ